MNKQNEQGTKIKELNKELSALSDVIAQNTSLTAVLSRFFGNSNVNINELVKNKKDISTNIDNARKLYTYYRRQLKEVWDYWTSYPPDWEERSGNVRDGEIKCEKCRRKTNQLHSHHVVPLSRGGSNKYDNLERLCEQCHSNAHNGIDFNTKAGNSSNPFSNRVELIEQAIKQNRQISFHYVKPNGESSNRIILPSKIENYEHERNSGSTLCVEGHCYSRNARRVFAIKRMSRLIID